MNCHAEDIDEAVTDHGGVEAVPLLAPDDDGGPKVDEGGDGQEKGAGPGIGRGARLVDHLGAIGEQGEVIIMMDLFHSSDKSSVSGPMVGVDRQSFFTTTGGTGWG